METSATANQATTALRKASSSVGPQTADATLQVSLSCVGGTWPSFSPMPASAGAGVDGSSSSNAANVFGNSNRFAGDMALAFVTTPRTNGTGGGAVASKAGGQAAMWCSLSRTSPQDGWVACICDEGTPRRWPTTSHPIHPHLPSVDGAVSNVPVVKVETGVLFTMAGRHRWRRREVPRKWVPHPASRQASFQFPPICAPCNVHDTTQPFAR